MSSKFLFYFPEQSEPVQESRKCRVSRIESLGSRHFQNWQISRISNVEKFQIEKFRESRMSRNFKLRNSENLVS